MKFNPKGGNSAKDKHKSSVSAAFLTPHYALNKILICFAVAEAV